MTSVDRPELRSTLDPLVEPKKHGLSEPSRPPRGAVPRNPFYGKYSDLFPGNGISPSHGNLRDDLSSMHVVLHRRENVAKSGISTDHISAICNSSDATHHKLLNPTYSNQTKTLPDHGFVNTPQSSLGAAE